MKPTLVSLPLLGQGPTYAPHGWPPLRLAFRPFYLLAALSAVLLMPLWWAVFTGSVVPATGLAPSLWHGHEMLFGFVCAVVVGFLLTAGKSWTGLATPRGAHLGALVLLWLTARVAAVLAPYSVFFVLDVAFLPMVAILFGDLLVRSKNFRNAGVAVVLMALGLANLGFHLGASGVFSWPAQRALHAGVALLVVLETVIGGRVIPFFTRNVTPGLSNTVPVWREYLLMVATLVSLWAWLQEWPRGLAATVLTLAAMLHAWRLLTWSPQVTLHRPILWSLHLAYAWIPVGLALLAWAVWTESSVSPALHAFSVGATTGLIIAMLTRTARGHTGRPLQVGWVETAAYVLVAVAALTRVVLPLTWPLATPAALVMAGVCYACAFGLYLAVYAPWLLRPRVDGQDG
ncbi:NnrS family protein [Paucibacter sp. DJ2R-2]|uniref:NnrS family protein n=1 Tax=Paucibacter sp. DJ2R-2 TaxID=2893558 RepID=UPI0021E4C94E|nr:NnrS family protein [Paucibacter sp. DJ2R-2]MCV2438674.1 NnrS family protein [Paucibacter sp. DJ2R-2]